MKGVIPDCLGKLIVSKWGKEKWGECLEASGFPKTTSFLASQDFPDANVMKLIQSSCKVLNITMQQAADAFGDYWVNDYASKIYSTYFRQAKNARELLLNMDKVHHVTTQNMPNAFPPRFDYAWENEKTLVMTYKSSRGLIDFFVSLAKGVGKYYKEDLKVMKLGSDKAKIIFS